MIFINAEEYWLASSVIISLFKVFAFALIFMPFLFFAIISQRNRQFMVMEQNQVQHLI